MAACPFNHESKLPREEKPRQALGGQVHGGQEKIDRGHANSNSDLSPIGSPRKGSNIRPKRTKEPTYYHSYLGLDKLLSAQNPKSREVTGETAHDEMLFIIIHQTYELWFKEILHDLDSCMQIFNHQRVDERNMHVVVERLRRITEIQKVTVQQLSILETMTPLSFLDFRDYLFPASGFQSLQFRLIENKLGLVREKRLQYSGKEYCSYLTPEHKEIVDQAEAEPSMLELLDRWLCRTPFLRTEDFDFWAEFQNAVKNMFAEDHADVNAAGLSASEAARRHADIDTNLEGFSSFFDASKYQELLDSGKKRLSLRAAQAAIMIQLYQDEPAFQLPFQLLTLLLDIDELLSQWRHRHSLMVHRMLGSKMGTGGSSGYAYLRGTTTRHKIFDDLFSLSMFLIPRASVPVLPNSVRQMVRFHFEDAVEGAEQARRPSPAPPAANDQAAQAVVSV